MMGCGEAWGSNGSLRAHSTLYNIEKQSQRHLILQIAAGDADRHYGLAVLEDERGSERDAGTKRTRMSALTRKERCLLWWGRTFLSAQVHSPRHRHTHIGTITSCWLMVCGGALRVIMIGGEYPGPRT